MRIYGYMCIYGYMLGLPASVEDPALAGNFCHPALICKIF